MIHWTEEEKQSMKIWDQMIDAERWCYLDVEAEKCIQEILLPALIADRMNRVSYIFDEMQNYSKVYVKEKRPGKGKRKSKGNVKAQRERYKLRQKIKRDLKNDLI